LRLLFFQRRRCGSQCATLAAPIFLRASGPDDWKWWALFRRGRSFARFCCNGKRRESLW
jgi:hypothetical protein